MKKKIGIYELEICGHNIKISNTKSGLTNHGVIYDFNIKRFRKNPFLRVFGMDFSISNKKLTAAIHSHIYKMKEGVDYD